MSSQKYQYKIGENLQGFEIKFDHRFRQTGNLFIETKEKSHPNNPNYVASGIYRFDNSWMFCLGDYDGVYLMQKGVLVAMHKKKGYTQVENASKTATGFLLPRKAADEYFDYIAFNSSSS